MHTATGQFHGIRSSKAAEGRDGVAPSSPAEFNYSYILATKKLSGAGVEEMTGKMAFFLGSIV